MKYTFFLFVSCIVGFLLSCSQTQDSSKVSFEKIEKRTVNSFVPEYISKIPVIKLTYKDYYNFNSGDFIISGKVDSNNFKQGYWKISNIKRILKYQGEYINDKSNGWWEVFSGNELICCGKYELNAKQGFWRYLNIDNKTKKFVNFVNDTLSGIGREYTMDSVLISDGLFKKGLKDGYWKFYNKTGMIREEGYFQDNYKSGWWQSYDENGKLVEEASYSRDEIAGYLKKYKNGVLLEEGKQFNGSRRGTWKFYDSNGKQTRIQEYNE